MFLPRVLSHPDVVGAGAARGSTRRNGTVAGGVVGHGAGVSQVSYVCAGKGSNDRSRSVNNTFVLIQWCFTLLGAA